MRNSNRLDPDARVQRPRQSSSCDSRLSLPPVPIFKAARNMARSLNRLLITAMPGGVEEVVRLIVSVADGEWRVWGRVEFDGSDGDTHGDDNDNGDDDGHRYAHH